MQPFSKRIMRVALGVGASSVVLLLAVPRAGQAMTISMCLNKRGVIQGVNVACKPKQTLISWDSGGVTGPQGLSGPQGPTGAAGPQGATGTQGLTGPAGATGSAGPKGLAGAMGPAGATGAQGAAGAPGTNGTNAQVLTGGTLGADSGFKLGILPGQVSTVYLGPGNGGSTIPGTADVPLSAGTLSHLLVSVDRNNTNCTSPACGYTFVVCVNSSCTTALKCQITDATISPSCSDTTDVVPISDGDLVSIQAEPAVAGTLPADVTFSIEHTISQTTP